ncbi:MAG: hypothetical protein Q8Q67_03965 [bacterium]|nr:hypothetical protein [bacterium]
MNDNSFLTILGLEYMDLRKVVPEFHTLEPDVTYYRKGKLNRFERELFLAEIELCDRVSDLTIDSMDVQVELTEEAPDNMIIDSDHLEAVRYMTERATANYIPMAEEVASLEFHRRLCWDFLEKKIRERFKIPWAQGFVITEDYIVYWYYHDDLEKSQGAYADDDDDDNDDW